jgi:acyl dehydratase
VDAHVGQELPTFERMAGFHAWNRYAAVNQEFVPIHMDDDAGRNAGNPGAFGMGNLQIAYLHALLRQWIGDDGRIVSVACELRAPSLRGVRTIARGRVTAVHENADETLVDLEVWTETEEGTVLAPGTATVELPQRGGA